MHCIASVHSTAFMSTAVQPTTTAVQNPSSLSTKAMQSSARENVSMINCIFCILLRSWQMLQINSISLENYNNIPFVNICFVVFLASDGCISIVGATMLIEGFLLPQCCFTPTVNIVFISIIIINAITAMDALFHVLFSHFLSSCMLIKLRFKAFQGLQ